ncbi:MULTISPECIES: PolC-type DNA polymerase III [Cytobacillus]|uniref:DNA polymerase III subunit epsilon n=1 Tax=Cytobacillus oceanisediminis 2691 TaxID=1196031 RepID=A0A160MI12_9BACI|nr:exonuclease domain-containing protein [Cytobacillus oceanisediminis]AND42398.1 DNA polymerase III subunit epsilon [Cytobacillus oceanisediminis 2691]
MFFLRKNVTCSLTYENIPLSTPLEDLSFIVFDTETTGFQVSATDRIIEIGAVPVKGFQVQEKDLFQTYVNPKRQISREIRELTSISDELVKDAPQALEAILSFFDYVESREAVCLVGHYVGFDALAIKSEFKREKLALKNFLTIDTLDLIGFIAPSYDMRDLERYAMAFGTRIYDRHSAVGDALTTAYLYVELLFQFQQRGHKTWGELIKATDSQMRSLF